MSAVKCKMFSLQNLCLDLIVQTFERFYFAFTVSKDENLQRNFEFLKRRFSVQVAVNLYEIEDLKDSHIEFLINEHLHFLCGEWLKNSRYLNSVEDIFRRLPNLTKIRFDECGDEILENIARFCPKIVEIDLRFSNITDNGIENFVKSQNGMVPCPELKKMYIFPSDVTNIGIQYLIRNLPSLECNDFTSRVPSLLHSIHKENLHESGKVQTYNLTELTFLEEHMLSDGDSLVNFTDVIKTCLTVCPKLQYLNFYLTDKEQLNLFKNINLKRLHLACALDPSLDRSTNVDNFLKLNGCNLTCLKFENCTVSVSTFAAHCPALEELSVTRVIFTDDDDDDDHLKPHFASLTSCDFQEMEPTSYKAICFILSSSPKLEFISFKACILSLELKAGILLWCENASAKKILFAYISMIREIKFLRDILLNCPSLKEMVLIDFTHSPKREKVKTKMTLKNLANSLDNKPEITVTFC